MTRLSVLTLAALIGVAGVAQAQQNVPLDPYGHPYVGSHDWHADRGDYTRERPGLQPPTRDEQAMAPRERMSHEPAFKDEYGFRYDSRGDRVDAQGHPMSPHNPNPN